MDSTTTLSSVPSSRGKALNIGLWILKAALGLLFLGAAAAKLAGATSMVTEFDVVGLGQWFRYAVAFFELVGAVLLLVPRTAHYGALVLAVACVGALIAQVAVIHQDWIHCVVIGGVLGAIAWAERSHANPQGRWTRRAAG